MDALYANGYFDYVELALEYANQVEEFSEYDVLIESFFSKDKAEKMEKSEEAKEKSTSFMKKAFETVVNLIKGVIESIDDFIKRLTLKGAEKDAFERFEEACRKDPSLKNKKITVKDYKKLMTAYENEIEKLEKAVKDDRASSDKLQKIYNAVSDKIDNLPKTIGVVTATVTTEVALRAAKDNEAFARKIKEACNSDIGAINDFLDLLGKNEKEKFKKEIEKASHKSAIARLIAKIRVKEQRCLADSVEDTISSMKLGAFLNPATRMGKILGSNEDTKDLVKEGRKIAGKNAVSIAKEKIMPKKRRQSKEDEGLYDFITGGNKKK